jgi:CheY-like chemotaxis protein
MPTILIVEDNPTNMKLSTFVLESADYTVITATDAEIGLTLARESHPDLILMDIQLPAWMVSRQQRCSRGRRDARDSGRRADGARDEGRRGAHTGRRMRRLHREAPPTTRSCLRRSK